MEFVIVRFDGKQRRVFIDNQRQGMTGTRQGVPEGMHVFDLGEPDDYTPKSQEVEVTGTSPASPMEIQFEAVVIAAGVSAAAPRPQRAAPAARARKTARKKGRSAKRARASAKRAAPRKGAARAKPSRRRRAKGKR